MIEIAGGIILANVLIAGAFFAFYIVVSLIGLKSKK